MLSDTLLELKSEPIVTYTGNRFMLPAETQKAVDEYWNGLMAEGKRYTRGEVFTISGIEERGGEVRVAVDLSDYAHYVYTRRVGLPEKYACKNIHTSCLIEAADDVLVFGRMAEHTSDPGNIQCVGGGLDFEDVRENAIDMKHGIGRELREEVGIESEDRKAVLRLDAGYLRYDSGIHSIAVIFLLKLRLTAAEFAEHYARFEEELIEKGEVPEFGSLIYLPKGSVSEFLVSGPGKFDHYMRPLLGRVSVL
ncbi:MAG: hypothetical protein HGB18_01795 [Candidatus Moranbacteria bacterium]|nr:hypothetical protein [Candidatus Moranbacteria bacterium]